MAESAEAVRPASEPKGRTAARIALAVILLGGLIVGGWVAVDLFSVRSSLQDARASIAEVRGSLGDIDVDAAAASLDDAEAELDDAERRSGRITWSIARFVPYVGPSIDVTRDVVDVASAAVEIAGIAVADGQQLIGDGLDIEVVDGRFDLQPLLDGRDLVADLPIDRLVAARDALATPREGWLPEEIRVGRSDTLDLADETVETLELARSLTAALPDLLGASEPRRYFVGFQTSAELRGTGGLLGFWGVLGVDDGQITFGQTEEYDPFDDVGAPDGEEPRTGRIGTIGLSFTDPPDADPAYLARYGTLAGARSFPNINLDPDLPTTAKAILDLFELQTGERLDGVILLDPPGLQRMLDATNANPLPLPPEFADELGLPDGLPVDRFQSFVTADVYETYGINSSDERKTLLRWLGDAAFLRIFDGSWDAPGMARAVAEATRERHLQVFTVDDPVQQALTQVDATGRLDVPPDADQLAVTANNVVGGKQDVHLGHAFDIDIDLTAVRGDDDFVIDRSATVRGTVDNPLPTSGVDEYIIGNCYVPGEPVSCFQGEPGTNRTWFSVWMPPGSSVTATADADGEPLPRSRASAFRDLAVLDHFLLTPSRASNSFEVAYDGRVPATREIGALVYEFAWWRQAKAVPDLIDVAVQPPEGWAIGHVEVVGGGDGRGTGVHGEGQELIAEVIDGVGHLRGTVNADTRLRVHLVAPDTADGDSVEAAR